MEIKYYTNIRMSEIPSIKKKSIIASDVNQGVINYLTD